MQNSKIGRLENQMLTLNSIKTGLLRNSEGLTSSSKYVVSFTGRRAIIIDHDLNLIAEVNKLHYVYKGQISPDEKYLLLISNGNIFYLYSLETFELIRKVTLLGTYSGNLEGRGCFSHDGKHFMLILSNEKRFVSTLRVYNVDNLDEYKDYLDNEYLIHSIIPVKSCKKYAIVASPEYEARCNGQEYNLLIWFDGERFEKHIISGKDDYITNVEASGGDKLTIYRGFGHVFDIDFNGKYIPHPIDPIDILKDDIKSTGNVELLESVSVACYSSAYPYCYVGASKYLLVYSTETKEVVSKINVRHRIIDIVELGRDLIYVVTIDSELMFKVICDE